MGMGNMQKLMQQAKKMQEDMARKQEELNKKTVETSSGGGAVSVVVTGALELLSIKIDPEVVDKEDTEMLEDLVLAAVNEGLAKAQELASREMATVTGGLGLPGM